MTKFNQNNQAPESNSKFTDKNLLPDALKDFDIETLHRLDDLMTESGIPLDPEEGEDMLDDTIADLPLPDQIEAKKEARLSRVIMFLILFLGSGFINACMPKGDVRMMASPYVVSQVITKMFKLLDGKTENTICKVGSTASADALSAAENLAKKKGAKFVKGNEINYKFGKSKGVSCLRIDQFLKDGSNSISSQDFDAAFKNKKYKLNPQSNPTIDNRQERLGGDVNKHLKHSPELSAEEKRQQKALLAFNKNWISTSFWDSSIPHGKSTKENTAIEMNIATALIEALKSTELLHYEQKGSKIIVTPRKTETNSGFNRFKQIELDTASGDITKIILKDGTAYDIAPMANPTAAGREMQSRLKATLTAVRLHNDLLTSGNSGQVANAQAGAYRVIKPEDRQFVQETLYMKTPYRLFWMMFSRQKDIPARGAIRDLWTQLSDSSSGLADGSAHRSMDQYDPSGSWKNPIVRGAFDIKRGMRFTIEKEEDPQSINYTPDLVFLIKRNGAILGAFHADGSIMEQVTTGAKRGWIKKAKWKGEK